MFFKKKPKQVHIADATGAPTHALSETLDSPVAAVTSHDAVRLNERMHLAAQPNKGEPLSHRNRSKAGRKG